MKNVRGSDPAGEIAVNVHVVWIEDFFHRHHRRNGNAAFIDAFCGDMRMAIDNSRDHELPRSVDNLSSGRRFDGLPDFGNLAVLDEDGAVLDGAMRNGHHRGVLNQDDGGSVGWSRPTRGPCEAT